MRRCRAFANELIVCGRAAEFRIGAVAFALHSHFRAHLLRAVGQNRRRHSVGRFVDQITREVLRFANNLRFIGGFLQRAFIAAGDHRQCVDLLVLAVAAIIIGIEIADVRALHDRTHRFLPGNSRRSNERKAADAE